MSEQPSIQKVAARAAPVGAMGQKYLARGAQMSMRLWIEREPLPAKPATQRDYETVGFVIAGFAELTLEDQTLTLEPGDSWVVPQGTLHSYSIPEHFTAIEVTSPPAQADALDEHQSSDVEMEAH